MGCVSGWALGPEVAPKEAKIQIYPTAGLHSRQPHLSPAFASEAATFLSRRCDLPSRLWGKRGWMWGQGREVFLTATAAVIITATIYSTLKESRLILRTSFGVDCLITTTLPMGKLRLKERTSPAHTTRKQNLVSPVPKSMLPQESGTHNWNH